MSITFLKRFFLEMLFDLIKPSSATSGVFIFGPFVSSDFKVIFFCKPSNKITSLLAVEYDKIFLKEIDFSLNTLIKLFTSSSLKFF